MKCFHTAGLRNFSTALPLTLACVVIASPMKPVFGMDVNQLQAKARQGFVAEQLQLGEAYLKGEGMPQSAANAAYWYEKAAQSGNPEAQNLMGYMYQSGYGVQENATKAVRWYELAASAGNSDAMVNLGVLHMVGSGVSKDPRRAAEYFQRAVERGNGTGAAYLGTMAFQGIGTKQSTDDAEHWFEKGAKLHDPVSAYYLGQLYSIADDHAHDFARAARYLRPAAKMNYVPAMQLLGDILVRHPDLPGGIEEAVRLLQTASKEGSWRASVVLSVMESTGTGMAADTKMAYFHLKLAQLQGGSAAEGLVGPRLPVLVEQLGRERAEATEAAAHAWFQQHSSTPTLVRFKGHEKKFFVDPASPTVTDVLSAGLPNSVPGS